MPLQTFKTVCRVGYAKLEPVRVCFCALVCLSTHES